MMEFKEAMRIWARLCKTRSDCCTCPMEHKCFCDTTVETINASEAEVFLAKWAAEHPEKTRLDDFLDKHPRAPLDDNDTPRACAKNLGYCTECIDKGNLDRCDDCWRRPLEEV